MNPIRLMAENNKAMAATSALERQIDRLVYVLYGLTAGKIRLKEESTNR